MVFYGTLRPSDRWDIGFDAEEVKRGTSYRDTSATVEAAYQINDQFKVEAGLEYSDIFSTTTGDEQGDRTDLGLRLTYAPNQDREYYVFAQGTVAKADARDNNHRAGLGARAQLTEKLSASAEVSDGSTGVGASARLTYQATADNQIYFGYSLDPSRTISGSGLTGRDKGVFVVGAKYRYSEKVSSFAENTVDLFGDRRSITEAYGVTYTPDSRWTYSGGLEVGRITDPVDGNFRREAYSFGLSFVDEDHTKGKLRLEYRDENGDGLNRDRKTYLVSGGYEYKVSEDWRFLASLDALVSESDQSSFRDGRYIEAALGYAYRPITNEKLNALVKLTYINDQPGEDQANADGATNGASQKSLVFSADTLYDLNEKWTVGVKYGYRKGQVAPRGTNDFVDNTAHLMILRADWHVVHKWDFLGEMRYLYTEESGTRERGALAAIYRHIGDNAKIGLGYEWGGVTDDLSNINYNSSGVFLNLLAKF